MTGKTNLAVILLLLFYTSMHAQETQTGQAAKPTSSVYNRMRPIPPAAQNGSQQNGTQQARQFPNPAQTKTVLSETALGAPGFSMFSQSEIAWTGTDAAHHLNVATLQGT